MNTHALLQQTVGLANVEVSHEMDFEQNRKRTFSKVEEDPQISPNSPSSSDSTPDSKPAIKMPIKKRRKVREIFSNSDKENQPKSLEPSPEKSTSKKVTSTKPKTSTPENEAAMKQTTPKTAWPHAVKGQSWDITPDGAKIITKPVKGSKSTKKMVKNVNFSGLLDYELRNPYSVARYLFKSSPDKLKIPEKLPKINANQILPSKFNLVSDEMIKQGSFIMELNYKLLSFDEKCKLEAPDYEDVVGPMVMLWREPQIYATFSDNPEKDGSHKGAFLKETTSSIDTNCSLAVVYTEKYPKILLLAKKDIRPFETLRINWRFYSQASQSCN